MANPHVFDVTAAQFQAAVVDRSMTTPVLLDFWASWCGPCKTLSPILEQLATEYGGAFVVGKVDTEREQDLAYAFQVQGIPYCVLLDQGRPVDGFTGALREAELRRFLARNGIEPAAPAAAEPPKVDPDSPAGRLGRAREAAARGQAAEAEAALAGFPEEAPEADDARRLAEGLGWLQAELKPAAGGAEAALAAARTAFLQQQYEASMEHVLDAARLDKGFRGGLPRKAMLLCFAVLGPQDERCDDYRRRLATLLY